MFIGLISEKGVSAIGLGSNIWKGTPEDIILSFNLCLLL